MTVQGLISFPQADSATRTLTFACRMCDFVEVDDKRTPIYRNDLLTVTREQAGVTTDLANDMTLVSALLCIPFYTR
jgi:DNA-directed RNA polymerase II subunit RPB9